MSKKLKPLGDRLVIKRRSIQKTKGGILLPETAQEKPKEGVVVAVGPGKVDEKGRVRSLSISEGDEILFSSYAGNEYKLGEEEYLILSEDDVLAVLGG